MSDRPRVGVVTGGGGGIGAAIAEEMGRSGWSVVTVDPLVTLEGTERLEAPTETTADRIVANGGAAMASALSVTDRDALVALFDELARDHGPIDAVVNVAGITRQTGFAHGSPEDWHAVLDVHLGGFLNILEAALPHMVSNGGGAILGVTSGSGWRSANAGAYSCAKRAIAALVWQLGRQTPAGVSVNAISPIAATRMVAAATERARKAGAGGSSGGLSLFDSMPQPADLAPLASHLVGHELRWCSGRVFFAGGSQFAVIEEPRLLELVRTDGGASVSRVLEATMPRAFGPAETNQASSGGGNPRFGGLFEESNSAPAPALIGSCLVVGGRPAITGPATEALVARSITCHHVPSTHGFIEAAGALKEVVETSGPVDAIVVALDHDADRGAGPTDEWQRTLAAHAGLVGHIEDDAGWARAASDYAAATQRPVRLLTLIDAVDAGGRSRAQACAQLSRSAKDTTEGRVTALSVGLEGHDDELADSLPHVVAYLIAQPEAAALGGAELVLSPGWFGLRSHPRPYGSITYGGPALPPWFDATMEQIVGSRPRGATR